LHSFTFLCCVVVLLKLNFIAIRVHAWTGADPTGCLVL
jgi:hypothetical protein